VLLYLWKVEGWWTDPGPAPVNNDPAAKIDLTKTSPGIRSNQDPPEPIVKDIPWLARNEPVELLRQSLLHYKEMKVEGYTCTLAKQERINGKLNPPEVVEAWFREEPYSVLMHWKEGAGLAAASLYAVGQNNGDMLIRPTGVGRIVGYVKRPPNCKEARDTSRYLITEFGIRCGTERTYRAWQALQDKGVTLNTEYIRFEEKVKEAGGRDCHIIKRYCHPPEEEGLSEITLYLDAETWLQVGTVLKANGDLIGSYFFRDIKINPTFEKSRFTIETLKKF
jgi:hypothetical protein